MAGDDVCASLMREAEGYCTPYLQWRETTSNIDSESETGQGSDFSKNQGRYLTHTHTHIHTAPVCDEDTELFPEERSGRIRIRFSLVL